MTMYINLVRERFISDLIQLICSTHPKFNVRPLNLGRPKLEFGSSHQEFDVNLRKDPY